MYKRCLLRNGRLPLRYTPCTGVTPVENRFHLSPSYDAWPVFGNFERFVNEKSTSRYRYAQSFATRGTQGPFA